MRSLRRLAALILVLAACGSLPAAAWAVDSTPPTVTFTGGVGVAPHLTNAISPGLTFDASDASSIQSVQCKVDSGGYADCSSPYAMPGLAEGGHTVFVKATDASAVHNTFTRSAAFIVDRTAPVIDLPATLSTNTTLVSWGYSDPHGPVTSVCQVDGGAPGPCSGGINSQTMPTGMHALHVEMTDGAGNTSPADSTVTVDNDVPVATFTLGPAQDAVVNAPPQYTVHATDNGSISAQECRVDTQPLAPCGPTFTVPDGLDDGAHIVEYAATDDVGHVGRAFRAFVLDTHGPDVSFDVLPGAYVNQALGFSITDALSPSVSAQCVIDLGSANPIDIPTCQPPVGLTTLPDGLHTVRVVATDSAQNVSPPHDIAINVDRHAPQAQFTHIEVNGTGATLTFTAPDISPVTRQCRIDDGTFGPCTTDSSYTVSDLAPGDHTAEVLVVDAAGNPGSAIGTFTIGEPPAGTTTTTGTPGTTTTTTSGGTLGGGTGGDTSTDTSPNLSARLKIDRPQGGATRNRLLVKCDEACALTVTLSDRNGKRLVRVTKQLLKGKQAAILLRVSASAFKGKRSLRVKLALRAVDKAGNPTTESRFITLRR